MKPLEIIGGGLAGCEAAWQAAEAGIEVIIYEMKPVRFSPAHSNPDLAELVCSNSFRGASLENAVGLLKEEMKIAGSLTMQIADETSVPAGGALAVDRELFSKKLTEKLESHKRITVVRGEVTSLSDNGSVKIIATGPLTSDSLAETLQSLTGDRLYFYDAIAPVIMADSIDRSIVFPASRYGKGEGDDYLNIPLTREQYTSFVQALNDAEKVEPRAFEKIVHFEGCMPVETLASRGIETLRFGPMKPVGLVDPATGEEPNAVVQLRMENRLGTMYNMVGFQTKLTYPEQQRVFRMLPGLSNAAFARLGSMHRNTFINSPVLLKNTQQLKADSNIFFAGQITGVEGYIESAASGLLAGCAAASMMKSDSYLPPPKESAFGSLIRHIIESSPELFQPSNINYGMFPPLEGKIHKKERRAMLAKRALESVKKWSENIRRGVYGE